MPVDAATRREAERLLRLFRGLALKDTDEEALRDALERKLAACRVSRERTRFRYELYRRLARRAAGPEDVARVVRADDTILLAIPMESEEAITGYHHSYDVERLHAWLRASRTVAEFLSAVRGSEKGLAIRRRAEGKPPGREPSRPTALPKPPAPPLPGPYMVCKEYVSKGDPYFEEVVAGFPTLEEAMAAFRERYERDFGGTWQDNYRHEVLMRRRDGVLVPLRKRPGRALS